MIVFTDNDSDRIDAAELKAEAVTAIIVFTVLSLGMAVMVWVVEIVEVAK